MGKPLTEDHVFDATRQSPVALLRALYEKNQVLVIGFSSHDGQAQYQMLDSLLRQVGQDPRLQRIVLERGGDAAPLLERSSTVPVPMDEVAHGFASPARAHMGLCLDGEFAYTWSDFLPHIRAVNATRPNGHKILVTTVDAVDFNKVVQNGQFSLSAYIQFAEGEYREAGTSTNFYRRIWRTLRPSDKVIMLYHYSHVIKTFSVLIAPQHRVPSNWMSTFLRDHPEAESHIGIVLLDAGTHAFTFTERQAARYPNQTFAVALALFRGVTTERDTAVFATSPVVNFGDSLRSSSAFPAMFDGVIWIADATPWALSSAHAYLPKQCP
jgi:hypothetical protein